MSKCPLNRYNADGLWKEENEPTVHQNCGDEESTWWHTIVSKDWIFILGFISSVLSACLGGAKALRLGICTTIADSDSIDIFTGRFLMAFLSCGLVGVSKGFMIAIFVDNAEMRKNEPVPLQIEVAVALCLGLFLPQLLLALWSSFGATKASLKTIIQHPSIIIVPMFTFFTFSKMNTFCGDRDVRIKFSPLYTWINMILSSVYGGLVITVLSGPEYKQVYIAPEHHHPAKLWTPFFVSGIVCTAIFLYYDHMFPCCCDCWLQPPGQVSVYDPDNPELELVWRHGRVEEVSEEEDEEENEKDEKIRKVEEVVGEDVDHQQN